MTAPQTLKEKIQTIIDEMNKADGWNATEMTAELAKRGPTQCSCG